MKGEVNMTGKAAVSQERLVRAKHLSMVGFVHVTGLPTQRSDNWTYYVTALAKIEMIRQHNIRGVHIPRPQHPEPVIIQASRDSWGHYAYNNGKTVLITTDGEVWLTVGSTGVNNLIEKYAPDLGAYVPCSNGEEVGMHLLLERVVDPYSDCNGHYSAIPNVETDEEIATLAAESNAVTSRLHRGQSREGFVGAGGANKG